jgi:cytoskeletal protein RodZ
MSVDEFFESHSIEEINKKTKISPISLRFIKNKEFDKLPRVKFIGFVRLIEKKYKVDLSELIKEYEEYFNKEPKVEKKSLKNENNKEIKEKRSYLWVLVLILFIISGYLYFEFIIKHDTNNKIIDNNKTENIYSINKSSEDINMEENNSKNNEINKSSETLEKNDTNISNKIVLAQKIEKNVTKEFNITIIPNELLWFRAKNIDNNKTVEYLTSKPKKLVGNYYIKFGHGNLTIIYNNKNIAPNTKKIVRILFKNGKFKYMKKPNEYEK